VAELEKVTGPLAEILKKHREDFNTRFQDSRHAGKNIDAAAFAAHLSGPVARIAAAVAAVAPQRLDVVADALYDLSLELFAQKSIGPESHTPEMQFVWDAVLPSAAGLLAADPRRLAGSLCNAVLKLAQAYAGIAMPWLREVQRLAGACGNVEEFLLAGQVAAWRCGLPHYRASALRAWELLTERLRYQVLGIAPESTAISIAELRQNLADPWYLPAAQPMAGKTTLKLVGRCGGFIGFGGQFLEPPLVEKDGEQIFAFDGKHSYTLHADCFGLMLCRLLREPGDGGRKSAGCNVSPSGEVTLGELRDNFPELMDRSSFAEVGRTLALTLERSHYVYVTAVVPE
jgi:hypothetical protein